MRYVLIFLIRCYQKLISPMKGQPCCRFYPSCSRYAVQALQQHGAIKGSLLAGWRLIRCNPWNLGGIDYVPRKFQFVPFHGNNHEKNL